MKPIVLDEQDLRNMKLLCRYFVGSQVEKVCVLGYGNLYASDGTSLLQMPAKTFVQSYLVIRPLTLSNSKAELVYKNGRYSLEQDGKSYALTTCMVPNLAKYKYTHSCEVENLAQMLENLRVVIYPQLEADAQIAISNSKMILTVTLGQHTLGVYADVQTDGECCGTFPYTSLAHIRKIMSRLKQTKAEILFNHVQFAVKTELFTVHVPIKPCKSNFKGYKRVGNVTLKGEIRSLRADGRKIYVNGAESGTCIVEFEFAPHENMIAKLNGEAEIYKGPNLLFKAGKVFYIYGGA